MIIQGQCVDGFNGPVIQAHVGSAMELGTGVKLFSTPQRRALQNCKAGQVRYSINASFCSFSGLLYVCLRMLPFTHIIFPWGLGDVFGNMTTRVAFHLLSATRFLETFIGLDNKHKTRKITGRKCDFCHGKDLFYLAKENMKRAFLVFLWKWEQI